MVPLLTVVSGGVGMVGGWIVTVTQLKVPSSVYWNSVVQGLYIQDVWMGSIKPFFIGFTIVEHRLPRRACARRGGTQGVGRATTNAVVAALGGGDRGRLPGDQAAHRADVLMAIQQAPRPPLLDEALGHGGPIIVFDDVSLAFDDKVILRECQLHAADRAHQDFSRRQRRRQVDDPAADPRPAEAGRRRRSSSTASAWTT